ncbi:MlaC/ttg2D family ABC transporter substrate-binding protein [Aquipseudomonas alcaligenes]|uniref:MlaC/ttg2D family ABC transporter substrate-binding protein n=1 Tax=Aquipseudomonas alcaligenes TaxID=43263 RepID=UPI0035ADDDFA
MNTLNLLRRGLLILLASLPLVATAAPTAHDVVKSTTDELIGDLKANKAGYQQNPQSFYDTLERILGPVVDSAGISRSIMTVKYSRRASDEQLKRFEDNFKRSLMQFYGNALLEYDNQSIRVLPAKAEGADRASVGMEVRDSKGTVYPVSYTMVQLDGKWKLRNVIINGINVGKLFRDQFADSMQRNGNDLDRTIDGWAEVVAKAKDSAEGQQASGQ